MNTTAAEKPSTWKTALIMIINPGDIVKKKAAVSGRFSLAISGAAFSLFFLQTGLDMYRVGQIGSNAIALVALIALIALLGSIYGTVGIVGIAALAWGTLMDSEGLGLMEKNKINHYWNEGTL